MLYKKILKARHKAYDSGKKEVFHADIPTICVGNVTVGGTGKTPHTEMILRMLESSGRWADARPAVLSRGYRRKTRGWLEVEAGGQARDFGDEPLQIKNKFPGITVAVDKDRVEGCRKLAELGCGIAVLDDAFQHRRLKASDYIVLVDYNKPVFEDRLLPFGHLRDLPERIWAADIIIVTKCPEYIGNDEKAVFAEKLHLAGYSPETCTAGTPDGKTITLLFTKISYLEPKMVFEEGDTRYIYSKKLILFSGIADDSPLRHYLSDSYTIMEAVRFPDHHAFTKKDLDRIDKVATRIHVAGLLTTEKDAQRLRDCKKVPASLKTRTFYLPIAAVFTSDTEKESFAAFLEKLG